MRWIIGGAVVAVVLAITVVVGPRVVHARSAAHSASVTTTRVAASPGALTATPASNASTATPSVSTANASAATASTPPASVIRWPHVTVTAVVPAGTNLVAPDFGGEIESITNEYGPGLQGYLLLDGSDTVSGWQPDSLTYPLDIILSFYDRDTALVSAVVIATPVNGPGADSVEVWTSKDTASRAFTPVARATLSDTLRVQTLSFRPVMARYIKIRVDSGNANRLALSQLRVVEGSSPGYTSLLVRHPDIPKWKTSVRHAAQRGIEWLEPQSVRWQTDNACFGCHVQAQTIMGLSIAQTNNYVISTAALRALVDFTRMKQDTDGHEIFPSGDAVFTPTQFAAMGLAYYDEANDIKTDPTLRRYVNWLASHVSPIGKGPQDFDEAPIAQGTINSTANAVAAFTEAFAQTGDSAYKMNADRSLAFIASDTPHTMQDKVFKIIVLSRYGTPAQRQIAVRLVQELQHEQDADGGWREDTDLSQSSPFATGQVLYAFKEAGISPATPMFNKGVRYLLSTQERSGAWPQLGDSASHSHRPSEFAPTMWAVIGLAGLVEPPTEESMKEALKKTGRIILYINFDFNKATLRPDSKPILAQVVKLLRDNPAYVFAVNGHTDSVGSHDYNVALSKRRAAAVVDALVAAGISRGRLTSGGFGPDQPIADNSTEKGRAKNRRVELVKQ